MIKTLCKQILTLKSPVYLLGYAEIGLKISLYMMIEKKHNIITSRIIQTTHKSESKPIY